MPNHVSNILKMKGIAKLPLFGEEKDEYSEGGIRRYFDFNKMIPMPASLEIESGSLTDECIIYHLTDRCTIPVAKLPKDKKELATKLVHNMFSENEEWLRRVFERAMGSAYEKTDSEKEKMYKNGGIYIDNYEKYGCTTWYDWCCNNWGTKWNAYELEIIDDDTIMFQTAWSSPEPVIEKLAEMYPDAHIEHWWADEDMGRNCGYREYGNGCWYGDYDDTDSQEAYEHYIKCWGETNCLYQDEDGNWQRHTCEDCHGCD